MPVHEGSGERVVAGRYRLTRVVGRGGMGVLWAAHDARLDREVAVKEIVPPDDLSPEEQARFGVRALREARAAARTRHPSAVTVYDVVEEDGRPWIVMQLLSPWSLADIINDTGPVAPATAARIGLDLLDALVAAHDAGVLHRDVKPGNVLFRDGRAVLVDFGIAAVDGSPGVTSTGLILGSPAFMPPERARGEPPALAGDLWSLGATLFAAVEGRPPFQRDSGIATLAAVLTEVPPAAEHADALSAAIAALLAPDAADRPTPDQARVLLQQALTGSARLAPSHDVLAAWYSSGGNVGQSTRALPRPRRRPSLTRVGMAAAVLLVAVVVLAAPAVTLLLRRVDSTGSPAQGLSVTTQTPLPSTHLPATQRAGTAATQPRSGTAQPRLTRVSASTTGAAGAVRETQAAPASVRREEGGHGGNGNEKGNGDGNGIGNGGNDQGGGNGGGNGDGNGHGNGDGNGHGNSGANG